MAGTGETLAIFIPFYCAAQVRANQADGDNALVGVLDGSRYVQPDDLMASWVFVLGPQIKLGRWTGIRLKTEKTEQASQAKQPSQAEEGISDEF